MRIATFVTLWSVLYERLSLSWRVLYRRFHCRYMVTHHISSSSSSVILLTSLVASDRGIFRVDTVVATDSIVATVNESRFIPNAAHIVQENGSSSLTKSSTLQSHSIWNERMGGGLWHWLFGTVLTYWIEKIPAVCKQLEHQGHPRSHHTQSPIAGCCRPQHDRHRHL